MNVTSKNILVEFKKTRKNYLELEDFVNQALKEFIKKEDFFVMSTEHRTKEIDSLEGKLNRKAGKYRSINEITDLVAFRIICYFADTVDAIAEKLSTIFDIDYKNSIDKRNSLQATEFGYISLHYVCYLKENDCKMNPSFRHIRFEIQLRSVLQHAWAEIEHNLGYKSHFGIPRVLRRQFSRTAGLLEIADDEFMSLRDDIGKYEEMVQDKIRNNEADDITLDLVSLDAYVHLNKDFVALMDEITEKTGAQIEIIDPSNYLNQLAYFGVETIADLGRMLMENKTLTYQMISERIEEFELDITTSNMILNYLCQAKMINGKYNGNAIADYFRLFLKDEERILHHVMEILEYQKSVDS